jgi:hypothetical protein
VTRRAAAINVTGDEDDMKAYVGRIRTATMDRIDLSRPFAAGMPVYPGDPPVEIEPHATLEDDGYRVSVVRFGSHAGTHVDAPSHTEADGPNLDELSIDTPYLESTSQVTLTGTRSGAGVASAAAALDALWPDGYREQYERARANATWLADELSALGYPVVDPTLPLVAADIGDERIEGLREAGWRLSRTEQGEARFVMQPHVTREMLRSVVADLRRLE